MSQIHQKCHFGGEVGGIYVGRAMVCVVVVIMEVPAAGGDVECCLPEPERWLQRASVPSSTQLQRCIIRQMCISYPAFHTSQGGWTAKLQARKR
eukprot:3513188-Ditylum_brightwellii.AAC.1